MILAKPTGRKYITRMDYPRTHGWWVRILDNRASNGKVSKFFRDTKYESKEEGFEEARKFRDRYFGRLTRAHKTVTHKGKLGKLYGRGITEAWDTKGKWMYLSFVATWWTDGKQHHKGFSASKYGYDEALRLAEAARAENTKGRVRG